MDSIPGQPDRWVTSAQSVSWWDVHLYVDRILKALGIRAYPAAGTPAWCELDDCDPTKLAAVLDYGEHHGLRVETAQVASCEASHDISAGLHWAAVGRRVKDAAEWFAAFPWMRREP